MLRLLLYLRGVIPSSFWDAAWRRFWQGYWRKEQALEQQLAPNAPTKPILGSERAILTEAVAWNYPFDSLLEVGCSFGQNFFSLASLFPQVSFHGVDIDQARLEQGSKLLRDQGIENVVLSQHSATDLSEFESGSFDIVLSCAMFLYLDPEQAKQALSEMLRLASGTVLLMEQHREFAKGEGSEFILREGRSEEGYWIHDYLALARELAGESEIRVERIPAPRWPAERWIEHAHLIEIQLSS